MRWLVISEDKDEAQETRELVISAFALGRALGITTILVQADEITDRHLVENVRQTERVIWIARDGADMPAADPSKDTVLVMPDASLNRLSQLNLALFLAPSMGLSARMSESSGFRVAGSRRLDTLVIAKPARDYPWLLRHRADMDVSHLLPDCWR